MSGGGVAMDGVAVFVWKNNSDFGAEIITLVSSKIKIYLQWFEKKELIKIHFKNYRQIH